MMSSLRRRILLAALAGLLIACAAGIMAVSAETESGRWVIHSNTPAPEWEHGMVTGNGRHGARVMGMTDRERIIINHEELFTRFWDRDTEMVADIAHLLPEVRRLIDAGKKTEAYQLANEEAKEQLTAKGHIFSKGVIPHPAFEVWIAHESVGEASDYCRQLDLETGESLTRWKQGDLGIEQRVFSSRPHDVNVVSLKATAGGTLDVTLFLKETPRSSKNIKGVSMKDYARPPEIAVERGWLCYDVAYGFDPGGYEGVARVTTKGGRMSVDDGKLRIAGADEILVLLRVLPQKDAEVPQCEALKAELMKLPTDYRALFEPHTREHGEMFRRVVLDFGARDEWSTTSTEALIDRSVEEGVSPLFLEQIHAMGRYLLISSCGKYPAPLQGLWNGSWSPPWQGGFVLDSNVNLAISSAAMGNLPECAMSYHNYIKGVVPGWRINARKYLGCRGYLAANYADPENGYLVHLGNRIGWMFWPGGAGWNLHPLYDYALLSGDREFMKKEVLPLYIELSEFYEDYLVMGDDGFYHIYPGVSPENRPRVGVHTQKDCAFDIAVAREVFRILIELGGQFELEETHGLMHVALMAARLHDVEKVRTNLDRLATRKYFYNNMASSCRKGRRISNLDASLSLPRLLMEMLVFSRPGHIELLPAWPDDFPDGSIKGVLLRGGHKIDLAWRDGKLASATIHAGGDDRGTLVYGGLERPFEFKEGESYRFGAGLTESTK